MNHLQLEMVQTRMIHLPYVHSKSLSHRQ